MITHVFAQNLDHLQRLNGHRFPVVRFLQGGAVLVNTGSQKEPQMLLLHSRSHKFAQEWAPDLETLLK